MLRDQLSGIRHVQGHPSATLAAVAISGAFTVLTAARDRLYADPLAAAMPQPVQHVMYTCTQQPWPYLNCVGTPLGDSRVRLITVERLGA